MKKLLLLIMMAMQIACFPQNPDVPGHDDTYSDSLVQVIKDSIKTSTIDSMDIILNSKILEIESYQDSIIQFKDTIRNLRFVNSQLQDSVFNPVVKLDSVTYSMSLDKPEKVIDIFRDSNIIHFVLGNEQMEIFIRKEDTLVPFMNFNILGLFDFLD